MSPENVTGVFASDEQKRSHNRAVVKRYMECRGKDRLRRHEMFTPDGCGGLWTTDTGQPIVIRGWDKMVEHAVWLQNCFPDWAWINVEIFDTQDPDRFWVECDGEGEIRFPGYPAGHYRNHFLHSFEFEGGKIRLEREFMNPFEQLRALGITVPEIRREGIPT